MMSRYSCLFSFLFLIGFLSGCTPKQPVNERSIDVVSALLNPDELKASDYFEKVRYIPLQTTDESVIGSGAIVQLLDDKIVITTSQKQCLLFDRATGRFITSVGHVGNDPEGYRNAMCKVFEQHRELYFQGWNNDWVCYDSRGKYKGTLFPPSILGQKTFSAHNTAYIAKDTCVTYASGFFSNTQDTLYFFTGDRVLCTIPVTKEDVQNFSVNDIHHISVLQAEAGAKEYGPVALYGAIILGYKDLDKAAILFPEATKLWRVENEVYYKGDYNDTIYRIHHNRLLPSYIFELGEYHWPYEDRYNKKRERNILITELLDSKDHLFFRFITDIHQPSKTLYNAFFSKATGEVKINLLEKGIIDDWNNFLSLQPLSVTSTGVYAGLLNAYDVVNWLDEHPDRVRSLPNGLKFVQDLDEEDNPVVFILD